MGEGERRGRARTRPKQRVCVGHCASTGAKWAASYRRHGREGPIPSAHERTETATRRAHFWNPRATQALLERLELLLLRQ